MKVSIVLPTYNESGNIVGMVNEVIKNIPAGWDYEVLVVDDNSPDGTCELVKNTFKDNPCVVPVLRTADRGFAKSIRAGIEKASGEQVIVLDSDFTHDPREIPKLLHVGQVYDVVSGSRFCPGGNMQGVGHYLASMVYNWFLRLVIRTQVQDNLAGYWTARKADLMALPLDDIFFGYGDYFFRFLHYAQHAGLTIVEIPVRYNVRTAGKSKSNFGKLLFKYTAALLKLRFRRKK